MSVFTSCQGGILSEDGRIASSSSASVCTALGSPIARAEGLHCYTFKVLETSTPKGMNIRIGVMDASKEEWIEDRLGQIDSPSWVGGPAYVYYVWTNQFQRADECIHGGWSPGRGALGQRDGAATGVVVKLKMDFENHSLSFSVNDGDFVIAPWSLPAAARPFVMLGKQGDAVELVAYEPPRVRIVNFQSAGRLQDSASCVAYVGLGGEHVASFAREGNCGMVRRALAERLRAPLYEFRLVGPDAMLLSDDAPIPVA